MELKTLHRHTVEHKPRGNSAQWHQLRCEVTCACFSKLPRHEFLDFGNDEHIDGLTARETTHAECTLGIVAERHILAQCQHRLCIWGVRDIHTRRVDLIVEGKATLKWDAALLEFDDTAGGTDKNHFPIAVVKEHHSVEFLEPGTKKVLRHLEVVHARNESTGVDERVPATDRRDRRKDPMRGPTSGHACGADELVRCECVHEEAVCAHFVVAATEFDGEQVAGCTAEPDTVWEQCVATELLPTGAEFRLLVPHVRGEHDFREVVVDELRQRAEDAEERLHVLAAALLQETERRYLSLGAGVDGRRSLSAENNFTFSTRNFLIVSVRRRLATDLGAGCMNPGLIENVALPVLPIAGLFLCILPHLRNCVLKVFEAHALVAVCEDAEAKDDVGVREFAAVARNVLANERNREHETRARHKGAACKGLFLVCHCHQSEGNTVDLL
eukprot:PhM_4_TR17906/c0_g2_i1/m.64752